MNQQSSRNLLYIAISQILLYFLGILGNKIAELINIPVIWLVVLTLMILAALIAIDFYKEHKKELPIGESGKTPNSSLTKSNVRLGVAILRYYPLALLLSGGAIFLASKMEAKVTSIPWWVIVIPIITTILSYPQYIAQEYSIGHKLKYMRVAAILALFYGGFGIASLFSPHILSSQNTVFVYAIISNIVNLGQNVAYIFYISEMVFTPWYNKLPE